MHTVECSARKLVPFPVNLTLEEERKNLDSLGNSLAAQEKLHYEGYVAYTEEPYSLTAAKTVLYFN